jgi:hypothetical protein
LSTIFINKIRCKKCDDVIESNHRHDFKNCKCGAVAVDGGKEYLRRCGEANDYEELSETINFFLGCSKVTKEFK